MDVISHFFTCKEEEEEEEKHSYKIISKLVLSKPLSESRVSTGRCFSLPLPCRTFLRIETLHRHWEICAEYGMCHTAAPRAEQGTEIFLQPLHSPQFCSGGKLCQSFSWPSFHLTAYQLSCIFILVWTQGTAVAALSPSMWAARRQGNTLGFLRLCPGLYISTLLGLKQEQINAVVFLL